MTVVPARAFGLAHLLVPTLRRWPFLGGVLRLSNHPWVWSAMARMQADAMARLRNGMPVRVRLGDFDGRMLFLFGQPDPRVVRLVLALTRQGDAFFDIGANYGAVGFLASDRVGPTGAVHLFEPQRDLCARITEALERAARPWIHLHECGVLDEDGELELWETPGHSGAASFAGTDAAGAVAVRVPVRDAARLLPPLAAGRSWAAKVDVEGVEMRILPSLLSMAGMRYVVAEVSHLDDPEDLWNIVRSNGHAIFGVSRSKMISRLVPIAAAAGIARFEDVLIAHLDGAAFAKPASPEQVAARIVPAGGSRTAGAS